MASPKMNKSKSQWEKSKKDIGDGKRVSEDNLTIQLSKWSPRTSNPELRYIHKSGIEVNDIIATLDEVPPSKRPKNWLCSKLLYNHSSRNFQRYAQKAWNYCDHLSKKFELIDDELQFPILPEQSGELTHLSAQIWILTFALNDISRDLTQEVQINKLNLAFAHLIYQGELTRTISEEFSKTMLQITNSATVTLQKATSTLESHFLQIVGREPIRQIPSIRQQRPQISTTEFLLSGNKIESNNLFNIVKLFMRTNRNRKWYKFTAFSVETCLNVTIEGLETVASTLIKLQNSVKSLQKYVQQIDSCFYTTLETSVTKMSSELNKIFTNSTGPLKNKITTLASTLRQSGTLIYSIQRTSQRLMTRILEVVAMTKLCYTFIRDYLKISFKPYNVAVITYLKIDLKPRSESEDYKFETKDFFKTSYGDVLRRVPVVINEYELGLHKYNNMEDFKAPTILPAPPLPISRRPSEMQKGTLKAKVNQK